MSNFTFLDSGGNISRLNGETQIFVIIGDPIAQVKSPSLLTTNLQKQGINAIVVPGHVVPSDIAGFMQGCASIQNLQGIIATIPHKQAMLGYCSQITERARYANSVNVMRKTETGWWGDNTDGRGYIEGIRKIGGKIEGKRVLLVGAGGAGAAIAFEFLNVGAAELHVHDIDELRRDTLIERLGTQFPGQVNIGNRDPSGFDIVGNATPLGMREGDPFPFDVAVLRGHEIVADVVTKPETSPLIEIAKSKGCKTMPGIGMFKAQESFLIEALLGKPSE